MTIQLYEFKIPSVLLEVKQTAVLLILAALVGIYATEFHFLKHWRVLWCDRCQRDYQATKFYLTTTPSTEIASQNPSLVIA